MELTNYYYYFEKAISPKDCKKIINLGLNRLKEYKKKGLNTFAVTGGNSHKQAKEKINKNIKPLGDKTVEETIKNNTNDFYVRDSEVSWLSDPWIYDLVYPYIHIANEKAGWNYDFDFSESFQFTKYGLNQFYGWHTDGLGDHFSKYKRFIPGIHKKNKDDKFPLGYTDNNNLIGKVRKLSITINLNEPGDYEGGNLKFDFGPHKESERYHECKEIRPQGSIIIFPSFVYHQVTPITKGNRYSLVLWTCGEPFK